MGIRGNKNLLARDQRTQKNQRPVRTSIRGKIRQSRKTNPANQTKPGKQKKYRRSIRKMRYHHRKIGLFPNRKNED